MSANIGIHHVEEGEAEAELSAPECDQHYYFTADKKQKAGENFLPHFSNRMKNNASNMSAFSSPNSLPATKCVGGVGLKFGLLPTPTIPVGQFIAAESDSFTDTWTPARKQHRKKRLIKKMAVDYLEADDSPVAGGASGR